LWGEATKVGKKFYWCEGNATVAVPVAISGDTSQPFFLVSFPQERPNLNAVYVDDDIRLVTLFCMHSPELKQKCDSGNRTMILTPFETFLKTYRVSFDVLKEVTVDYAYRKSGKSIRDIWYQEL